MPMSIAACHEYAIFSSAEGVDASAVPRAVAGLTAWLRGCAGYVDHELRIDTAGGRWVHVVAWRSRAEALDAMQRAGTVPEVMALGAVIDMTTLQMFHADLPSSAPASDR